MREYGRFLTVPVPNVAQLEALTRLVAKNNGFNLVLSGKDAATMEFLRHHIQHGDRNPIRHVELERDGARTNLL